MHRRSLYLTAGAVALLSGLGVVALCTAPGTDPATLAGALPSGPEADSKPSLVVRDDGRFDLRFSRDARAPMLRDDLDLDAIFGHLPGGYERDWLGDSERREGDGIVFIHHARTHDGAVVFDQHLTAIAGPDGLERVRGRLAPVQVVAARTVGSDAAVELLEDEYDADVGSPLALLVATDDGRHRHVWAADVEVPADPLRVWIDGADGSVMAETSRRGHVTGQAQVFDRNQEQSEPVVREVTDLVDGSVLATETWTVEDATTPGPVISVEGGSFLYDPSEPWFTAANAFHHLQRAEEFQRATVPGGLYGGLVDDVFALVNITPDHPLYGDYSVNAFHWRQPLPGAGHRHVFGFGIGGGPTSWGNTGHDADAVAHEYGHGATEVITRFEDADCVASDPEYRAIHEGLSDYAAAALQGDPLLAEGVIAPDGMRRLDEHLSYPDDLAGEHHRSGLIAGSAGWALREAVGSDIADPAVLGSRLYFDGGHCGFEALGEGILAVDEDFNDGRYQVPMLEVLIDRGLVDPGTRELALATAVDTGGLGEEVRVRAADASGVDWILGFEWTLAEVPPGSSVTLDEAAKYDRELSFVPDVAGTYTLFVRGADARQHLSDYLRVEIEIGSGCAASAVGTSGGTSLLPLLLLPALRRRRAPVSVEA